MQIEWSTPTARRTGDHTPRKGGPQAYGQLVDQAANYVLHQLAKARQPVFRQCAFE